MIQDGLWAAAVASDVSCPRATTVERQITPTKAARAMQRCGDVMLRAVNRSFLGQAHVLGEPLVSADIEADERCELAPISVCARGKPTDGASGRDLRSSIGPALVFRYDDTRRCPSRRAAPQLAPTNGLF